MIQLAGRSLSRPHSIPRREKKVEFPIPVRSFDEAWAFYGRILGCTETRSSERHKVAAFNFFGNELVVAEKPETFMQRSASPESIRVPRLGAAITKARLTPIRDKLWRENRFYRSMGPKNLAISVLDPSGLPIDLISEALEPSAEFRAAE
jgi:hypothetical protein